MGEYPIIMGHPIHPNNKSFNFQFKFSIMWLEKEWKIIACWTIDETVHVPIL
jgi:hypothetical protein